MTDKKNSKPIILKSGQIFTAVADEPCFAGYIVIEEDRIGQVGQGEIPAELVEKSHIIDYRDCTITPGLIDAHTHLVHGGSRENELAMKLNGKSYMDIHNAGGGIFRTMRDTRSADREELKTKALNSLAIMLEHGTTTVEAKSGYGLNLEKEIECLELNRELNRAQPIDVISTFMGAHATPPEFGEDVDGWLCYIEDEIFPIIKEKELADFVDAFCEDGIFSVEQTRKHLLKAKEYGWNLKMHADEIAPMGGAELAAELECISAEHLMAISDSGIQALAAADVTAVLLPATSYFLMAKQYAPAHKMWESGVRVALATDYNPGSSPTENLQQVMWHACYQMKLTPEQIFTAVTANAAYALCKQEEIGTIEEGKRCDLTIFDAPNLSHILYHFGINRVCEVWKNGQRVLKRQPRI